MSIDNTVTEMIEFILQRATRYELDLLMEALKRRMERETSLGQLDFQYMARNMAEGFSKKMGMDTENIHRMSRRLVADMIRSEIPGISEEELAVLLDQWLSGKDAARSSSIPKEMLLAMITQFVSYSTGEMSEEDKRQFPEGWAGKYWDAFQPDIQRLIKSYLTEKISKDEFWKGIGVCLAAMK
ncbi:MAG: hypothetical protein A2W19_08650 [Spirochaetes bacterium RBG_16_49_21]|nr:MAG: hypothetical protein A2W19_08650 [Spirochaetes bacterium RBG_16_49_21]